MRKITLLMVLVVLSGFSACGKSYKSTIVKSASELQLIKCIAVLPFDSTRTRYGEEPGKIVATLIANKLLATGKFLVLEWEEIDSILRAQNVALPASVDASYASRIGEILSVEGVLFGAVTEYGYKKGQHSFDASPVVGILARLLSVKSKDVVWSSSYARSSGDLLDTGRDPLTRVAMLVVDELVESFASKVKNEKIDHSSICWNPFITSDIDGDEILNFADNCPLEPETFEGILDTDGCPEPKLVEGNYDQLVKLRGDKIVYKGKISYVRQEATLLPSSVPILKGVASLINRHPEIRRVTIEGFSEEIGKEKFIEEFSFNRAMAIKYFLLNEGVQSEKLAAVGYDKTKEWQHTLVKEIEFSVTR